jgi:hypothetical protein
MNGSYMGRKKKNYLLYTHHLKFHLHLRSLLLTVQTQRPANQWRGRGSNHARKMIGGFCRNGGPRP